MGVVAPLDKRVPPRYAAKCDEGWFGATGSDWNPGGTPEGEKWSGRPDSNRRPPAPKAGALPGCATPRHRQPLDSTAFSHGILIALVRFSGELLQNLNTPRVPLPKELRHPFVGDASCTGTSRGRRIQIERRR